MLEDLLFTLWTHGLEINKKSRQFVAAGFLIGAKPCISPWQHAWRQVEEMKVVGTMITPDASSRRALLHRQAAGVIKMARYKKAYCPRLPYDAKLMGWSRHGQGSAALGCEMLQLTKEILLIARRWEFDRLRVAFGLRPKSDDGPMESGNARHTAFACPSSARDSKDSTIGSSLLH